MLGLLRLSSIRTSRRRSVNSGDEVEVDQAKAHLLVLLGELTVLLMRIHTGDAALDPLLDLLKSV